eukprot:2990764-Lingulodinium_polyedra.AAC.1
MLTRCAGSFVIPSVFLAAQRRSCSASSKKRNRAEALRPRPRRRTFPATARSRTGPSVFPALTTYRTIGRPPTVSS